MITKVGIRVKDVEIDTLMEILDADGSGEYIFSSLTTDRLRPTRVILIILSRGNGGVHRRRRARRV